MDIKEARDAQGRFRKGFSGNPDGRPPRPVEIEYLKTLYDVATLEKWREAVQKRVQKAIDGDEAAFQWLESYVIGRERLTLDDLAKREALGIGAADEFDYKLGKAVEVIHHMGDNEGMLKILDSMRKGRDEKPYLLLLQEHAAGNEGGEKSS